jgi:DNA-binding MarR family transcriptional regulator
VEGRGEKIEKKCRNRIFLLFLIIITLISLSPAVAQSNQEEQEQEQDTDGDGMPDSWEEQYGLNANNSTDGSQDYDNDGLTNVQEYENNTDPNNYDTDGGGVPDGQEVENEFNPNDRSDDRKQEKPKSEEKEAADSVAYSFCFLIFVVPGIVILLVIIFVYTKMRRDKLLDHHTRNRIYEYINHNPGTHYRAVMNDLNLHMGTLTHHVNMLEHQRYIKSYQDGMYRRFYPIDAKIQTGLMLTDVQKKILRTVQGNLGISQTGIAKKLGMNRKIIHYHIKLLADAGFIHVETSGRETNIHYIGGLDIDTNLGLEGASSSKAAT